MNLLKEITVYQLMSIAFFMFLTYAVIDVFYKVNEHKKYDMDKILSDIKKEYPKAIVTFQNIKIEGNHAKRTYSDNGAPESYYETIYVYIKNNQLKKEPNFIWLLFAFPPLLFLTVFHQDPRTLKIKDLYKVSLHTWSWIIGSVFISIIMSISSFSEGKYVSPYRDFNEFNRETTILLNQINLDNYKKQSND